MTTRLYDEWASWSTKNTEQGVIFTSSIKDFNLAPDDRRIIKEIKCGKGQFDGVVKWCCNDPRAIVHGVVFGYTGADDPIGATHIVEAWIGVHIWKKSTKIIEIIFIIRNNYLSEPSIYIFEY